MRIFPTFFSAFFLVACARAEQSAKENFARIYVCPDDRISTKTRKDINGYDLMWGPYVYQEPAAEIKADPERLAVWNSQQEEIKRNRNRGPAYETVEVSGCGVTVFYACSLCLGTSLCSERDYKEQIPPDTPP